jgi:hypothetical protein
MSEIIKWQDSTVEVEARLVPRFLWNTASIDVFLGGQCILRTGGQLKLKGSHSTVFTHSGSEHTAELSWGMSASPLSFPYQLRLDGILISSGRVRIRNWPIGLIVVFLIAALLLVVFHFLHVLRI